jgi:hypothetical protein
MLVTTLDKIKIYIKVGIKNNLFVINAVIVCCFFNVE